MNDADIARMQFVDVDTLQTFVQPQFGVGFHDSIQYHFFWEDRVFALRVFKTPSLFHHSCWIYDGKVRELLNSNEPMTLAKREHVDLSSSMLKVEEDGSQGLLDLRTSGDLLRIEFKVRNMFFWDCPSGPGYHQPDLDGRITYKGKSHMAIGYCKRYWFFDVPYWGYRFVQGPVDDRSFVLWTADATFKWHKYAYFKIATKDGRVRSAALKDSVHRENRVYGVVDGVQYEIDLQELGVWETILRSHKMDSQMRQRFCKMTVRFDGKAVPGYAINETCFGTLG